MEEGPCPWPEDMERRRLADLEKFAKSSPQCMQSLSDQPQPGNRSGGKRLSLSSQDRSAKKPRRTNNNENRWDLATTLELLESMKFFVRSKNLRSIGGTMANWKAVAIHLSNPYGLELTKFARSCQVRFDNLRRYLHGGKRGRIEQEIQVSLEEFLQLCKVYPSALSSKSLSASPHATPPIALSTTSLSASPHSTPPIGKLVSKEDQLDDSCGGDDAKPLLANDDGDEIIAVAGNCHLTYPTSERNETRSKAPAAVSVQRKIIFSEEPVLGGGTEVGRSRVARTRLGRVGLSGTRLGQVDLLPKSPSAAAYPTRGARRSLRQR